MIEDKVQGHFVSIQHIVLIGSELDVKPSEIALPFDKEHSTRMVVIDCRGRSETIHADAMLLGNLPLMCQLGNESILRKV